MFVLQLKLCFLCRVCERILCSSSLLRFEEGFERCVLILFFDKCERIAGLYFGRVVWSEYRLMTEIVEQT